MRVRRLRDSTSTVLLNHCKCAARQISESVCQIRVIRGYQRVITKISVLTEYSFPQHIVAESVHAEHVGDGPRENYIAFGLGHFAGVHQKPAVRPNLFRSWKH